MNFFLKKLSSNKAFLSLNLTLIFLGAGFFWFSQSFKNTLNLPLDKEAEESGENPPNLPLGKGGADEKLVFSDETVADQFQTFLATTNIPLSQVLSYTTSENGESTTNLPLSQRGIEGVLSKCRHCIQAKNIRNNSLSSNKIKNKSLLSEDIASNQINSRLIENESIQREDLSQSLQSAIYETTITQESDPLFSTSEANNFIQGDKAKLDSLNNYVLPVATTDTLGGIKIGSRLTITNGVLSADIQSGSGLVDAVNGQTGIVLLDPDDLDDATTAHKFVSATQITNWNTAYGWGNHSSAGYLTSISGLNISVLTNDAGYITDGNTNWNNTYGFITSYTETDPNVSAWAKAGTKPTYTATEIGLGNVPNLTFSGSNTGDETTATIKTKLGTATTSTDGYLTSTDWNIFNSKQPAGAYLTAETDPIFNIHSASTITSENITNWTTAHSWGDHSASGYLTSYTETDPTFTSSQANNITASHITILGNTSNTNTGDETQSSIKTKLTVADTDTDGYLSFTDWNIFNSKQPAGSYLISYSETDPVFASSQANNITATHITTLNNTSGTNTGDQSASDLLTALKTVDGSTSGLDADLLDGYDSSAFGNATAANQTTILSKIGTSSDSASLSDSLFAGQQEIANILGSNDDNNTFSSEQVLANENGSVLERLEYLQRDFQCGDTVVDEDGNLYGSIMVGNQCWMNANLKVGTRVNGASNQTDNAIIEKYCYSDDENNCIEGGLYQWDEAMQYSTTAGAQGICPLGWHIPTDNEQFILEKYLADTASCDPARSGAWDCGTAGTRLKTGGNSGLNFALAGYRNTDGSFYNRSSHTNFWSSSESGSNAWLRHLYLSNATVFRYPSSKLYGFSVRCLKD